MPSSVSNLSHRGSCNVAAAAAVDDDMNDAVFGAGARGGAGERAPLVIALVHALHSITIHSLSQLIQQLQSNLSITTTFEAKRTQKERP